MTRHALLGALACLVAASAQAQSLPSKKEAAVLLEQAIDTAKLKAGGTPFHLVAKLHYDAYGQSSDGVYELLWADPDRFREEFRLGTVGETDVVAGEKRYVLRNGLNFQLALWRLRFLLDSPLEFLGAKDVHVSQVYSTRFGPDAATCVKEDSAYIEREVCFDSASSRTVSAKMVAMENKSALDRRLSDFLTIGPKAFPATSSSTFRLRRWK
jgi:hypothetical protein